MKIKESNVSLKLLIYELWSHISKKRKKQLIHILITVVLASLSELISLGSVIPFLEVLTNPTRYWSNPVLQSFIKLFRLSTIDQLIFVTTIIFCFAIIFSTTIRLYNLRLNCQISSQIASEISKESYRRTLYQSYEFHLLSNSSKSIAACTSQTKATYDFIGNVLNLIAYAFISLAIYLGLFIVNWKIALASSIIFISVYFFIGKLLQPKISANSKLIANLNDKQVKLMQEGLGAIREILLGSNQEFYINKYAKTDSILRLKTAQNSFIAAFPKYSFEALGMIIIALLGLINSNNSDAGSNFIVFLGVFALGSQRLLPSLQQVYGSWALMRSTASPTEKILEILRLEIPQENISCFKKYNFKKSISLQNISFSYDKNSKNVLENINLQIFKGEKIGFIGKTGGGKTTLIDIIIGLLKPVEGKIFIDGNDLYNQSLNKNLFLSNWRSSIAYVPQSIFLGDFSIRDNITFGFNSNYYDKNLLEESAKIAMVLPFSEKLPKSLETITGERGLRLSGGQRQRIGIARAIYKQSKVLVLDEATSALDQETEASIIENISKFDKGITILMIAHRISTLKNCDRVFEISEKNLKLKEIKI